MSITVNLGDGSSIVDLCDFKLDGINKYYTQDGNVVEDVQQLSDGDIITQEVLNISEEFNISDSDDTSCVYSRNRRSHNRVVLDPGTRVLDPGHRATISYPRAFGTRVEERNQQNGATAIGLNAGRIDQGIDSVAIGRAAGLIDQTDNSNVVFANQSRGCIAIGPNAGSHDQNSYATAIGTRAGERNQQNGAIAMGLNAGRINQGINSIAMGRAAGLIDQAANSIIINATGISVNSDHAGFYVNPIRVNNDTTGSTPVNLPSGCYNLCYNPISGEIFYQSP